MAYTTLKDLGVKSPYKEKYDNFIGGKWVKPVDGKYFENITCQKVCVYDTWSAGVMFLRGWFPEIELPLS